jgi:hypothetical protein
MKERTTVSEVDLQPIVVKHAITSDRDDYAYVVPEYFRQFAAPPDAITNLEQIQTAPPWCYEVAGTLAETLARQ